MATFCTKLTQNSIIEALNRYKELSRKDSPLQWSTTIYLDIPMEYILKLRKQRGIDFTKSYRLKTMAKKPRIIIYEFNDQYFLLYGEEIIMYCIEEKMTHVPSVIWSSRPVKWVMNNDKLIPTNHKLWRISND
jgi:hypothetical protein